MSEFTCDSCRGPILYMEEIAVVSEVDGARVVEWLPSGNIIREPAPTGLFHRDCWPSGSVATSTGA